MLGNTVILGDGGGTYTLTGNTRVTIGVDDADGDGDLADEGINNSDAWYWQRDRDWF